MDIGTVHLHKLPSVCGVHECLFLKFRVEPACAPTCDCAFPSECRRAYKSLYDKETFYGRECDGYYRDILSHFVVFPLQSLQEPGFPANHGSAQTARHCLFQHPGVQFGQEVQLHLQNLRNPQDYLLGDTGWALVRLYFLCSGQLPH